MRILIVGAGNVGKALGTGWLRAGHEVTFGVRDPQEAKNQALRAAAEPSAQISSLSAQAATQADVVVLALPWLAAESTVRGLGPLTGKIVIDATNPIKMGGPEELAQGLLCGHSTSAAEQVAAWTPGARVVKAFNCTGAGNLAQPDYPSGQTAIFICGDDAEAKATVMRLTEELRLEPVDAGELKIARLVEPVAMLWIHLAVAGGFGADFAFQIERRPASGWA